MIGCNTPARLQRRGPMPRGQKSSAASSPQPNARDRRVESCRSDLALPLPSPLSHKVSPVCCRTLFRGQLGSLQVSFTLRILFVSRNPGLLSCFAAKSRPRSYTTGLRHGPSTSRRRGTAPPASRPGNEALGATGTMARDADLSSHSDLLPNGHGLPQHGRSLDSG